MVHPLDAEESNLIEVVPNRRRVTCSLRALFILTLVVAAFLAGYGMRYGFPFLSGPAVGTWQITLPLGATHEVQIRELPDGKYFFPGSTVFGGIYKRDGKKLYVVTPSDKRMTGMIWKWEVNQWTLVSESPSRPTGATYIGTTLTPVRD